MHQLSFSFGRDKGSILSCLERLTCKKILLFITDNSSSMLTLRLKGDSILLRIHKMFLFAGDEILQEIADFIKNSKIKTPLVRNYINQNGHQINWKSPPAMIHRTQGNCFNLMDIYNAVNHEYFNGNVSAHITWGAKGPKRAARSRTLGSYTSQGNLVRINPILDNKKIPRYFVDYIVYHEMLHADIGIDGNTRPRSLHSKEFRQREKLFKHYERAIAWEKKRW